VHGRPIAAHARDALTLYGHNTTSRGHSAALHQTTCQFPVTSPGDLGVSPLAGVLSPEPTPSTKTVPSDRVLGDVTPDEGGETTLLSGCFTAACSPRETTSGGEGDGDLSNKHIGQEPQKRLFVNQGKEMRWTPHDEDLRKSQMPKAGSECSKICYTTHFIHNNKVPETAQHNNKAAPRSGADAYERAPASIPEMAMPAAACNKSRCRHSRQTLSTLRLGLLTKCKQK
jgi:hypothetical protein